MSENEKGHSHHVTPIKKLNTTFIWLALLMGLTIAAARAPLPDGLTGFLESSATGPWITNILAMAIAVAKATFVIMIFMGLKGASTLSKYMAAIGVFCFGLMFMMMFDYSYRQNEPVGGWEWEGTTSMQRSNEDGHADDRFNSWERPAGEVQEDDGGH